MRPMLTLILVAALGARAGAAELILPENRTAYASAEPVRFAVAGLKKGEKATVEFVPAKKSLTALKVEFKGEVGTLLAALPGFALAPDSYVLRLDGKPAGTLTVASGVNLSTMYFSQTVADPKRAGGNFFL